MADIASLSLEVKSDSVKTANVTLREMVPAASAAERAAQKWGMTTSAAARSSEDFSKRVQGTIRALEFERQQLTRNAAEQQKYAALRRAGVSASSAEGQAIAAAVAALQAQKAANEANSKASGVQVITTRAAGSAWRGLLGVLAPLTAAMTAASVATKIWDTAMTVADFGEKADQIGLTVKGMQALQFAAVQNGLGIEQLENGVAKFSQKIGEAAEGSKEMIDALNRIGVKALDAAGGLRPTEDLLFEVAQKIVGIEDPARRAAAAVDFFGKAGVKMLPLLAEMAKGQDAVTTSAENAGAVISADVVATLDKFSDRLARAGLTSRKFFADIAADIIDWGNRVEAWWDRVAPVDPASMQKRNDAWRRPFEDFFDWLGDSFADIIAKVAGWSAGFVAAFKELGPALKKVFADAMNGVISAIEDGLNMAQQALSNAKGWFKTQAAAEPIKIGRLDPGAGGDASATGRARAEAEAAARAGMPNSAEARDRLRFLESQARMQVDEDAARGGRLPAVGPALGGARNPGVKGGAGSDPYAKAIESAREYILTKKAETEAVGQTVLAASRLKHEQELLNKAQNDGKVLTERQVLEVKNLAGAMAEADNKLATAKFMDDAKTKSEDFIAAQEMERQALFMSAEAADALRYSTEMLNEARRAGIELTPDQVDAIRQSADAMAAAAEQTRKAKEWADFERETFKGFFSDLNQGLREGQTIWESFGNAALNALNKITDKLISMAAEQLFNAAFPSGVGGGIMSLLGLGGGGGDVWSGLSGSWGFANGAAFHHGNVVPFASGGMVTSPTMFPMSRGRTGLMGEAGPEAIMPLRRGPNGSLGVQMHGGAANENTTVIVNQTVHVGEFVTTQQFAAGMRNVKKSAEEGAQNALINRKKRGGLQDVF